MAGDALDTVIFERCRPLAAADEMTPDAILTVMARYATYPAGTRAPEATD